MPIQLMIVVVWTVGILASVFMGAAALMYVYSNWKRLSAESDESIHQRILDQVDQIQIQLYSMSERLESMEKRLSSEPAPPTLPAMDAEADPPA